MLTPVFHCEQDGDFIIITITLSAICKALEASFDIVGNQFTFFCRPYYLRLKFNEMLMEGRGERATYDLEKNEMRVWVPKETAGQQFTALDNPAYLIATEKERARIAGAVSDEGPALGEEEETEFVQTLAPPPSAHSLTDEVNSVTYGFANHFSGIFRGVDEDIVSEMIALTAPERTSAAERRLQRLAKEHQDFDEDALILSHMDADGEVAALLQYVPDHVRVFQDALRNQGVRVYSSASPANPQAATRHLDAAYEEEEITLLRGAQVDKDDGGGVEVWAGNVAQFKRPILIEELNPDGTPVPVTPVDQPEHVELSSAATATPLAGRGKGHDEAAASGVRLALPSVRPSLSYTQEENRILAGVRLPRLLFRPSLTAVAALTLDILFVEAYDDLFTEGQGCSESVWNLCTLSPALSFLDPAATVYDACVFFARRALIYPLHRHFDLVRRIFAVVGTRLLMGRAYVLRALLRVYSVLSHSEHRHVLDTIFLEPLIAYWLHRPTTDEDLTAIAIELHEHVTRVQPVVVTCKPEFATALTEERAVSLLQLDEKKTLAPITLVSLDLPFSPDEVENGA